MPKAVGVCAIDSCPALRAKGSWLCKAHDAQAKMSDDQPTVRVKKKRTRTASGLTFAQQCSGVGLPVPLPEYTFHPQRKWRFDYAWRDQKLAMEIEGGAFLKDGGRHTRGAGFRNDLAKYAEAAILGWRVIRVLPEQVENGQALKLIERALTG